MQVSRLRSYIIRPNAQNFSSINRLTKFKFSSITSIINTSGVVWCLDRNLLTSNPDVFGHLAQLAEHSAVNRVVTGSSPVMSVMGVVNPMG